MLNYIYKLGLILCAKAKFAVTVHMNVYIKSYLKYAL